MNNHWQNIFQTFFWSSSREIDVISMPFFTDSRIDGHLKYRSSFATKINVCILLIWQWFHPLPQELLPNICIKLFDKYFFKRTNDILALKSNKKIMVLYRNFLCDHYKLRLLSYFYKNQKYIDCIFHMSSLCGRGGL